MSSRNVLLSPQARPHATCLFRALQAGGGAFAHGERRAEALRAVMRSVIDATPMARIDYVSVAHPESLAELEIVEGAALLSLAVFVDEVRLIDNVTVGEPVCAESP